MATGAAYAGATFTLGLTLGAVVGLAWSLVTKQPPIMDVVSGAIGLISGYVVVFNDWPRIWKPLFTGGK